MVGLGAQLARSVEAEARAQGRRVLAPDAVRAKLGDEAMDTLAECALEPVCAARVLRPLGARQAVLGRLGRDGASYLVRLVLLDVERGVVVSELDRAILIAARRLQPDVRAALPGLLRGEQDATGTLQLEANVPGAEVEVDGEAKGLTPLTLTLKPGRHRLLLRKDAHYPVERLIDVEAGERHVEQVRLTPTPPAADAPLIQHAAVEGPVSTEAAWASRARLEAAGVLGGAALVALGTSFGLHQGAQAQTGSSPQQLRRAGNVALGVGAVAAVAGAFVWLWDASVAETEGLQLVPTLSTEAPGVVLSGRFD
jgi:hypothetical protein